jgi:integrase
MSLNLYRRHCEECEARRAPDSKTGEFEERKKGWKRCSCSIFASGTLNGTFRRRSTGLIAWDEANAAISKWKSWDVEMPAPVPAPAPKSALPPKITIEKAIKDFIKEHTGESADSTVRMYRYLLEDFSKVSTEKGFIALEQWGPADIREYRKSWNGEASTATKKMSILKTFFEYCLTNEWINRNPARLVRQKHNRNEDEERERIPFSDEELARMFKACESSYGKGEFEYRYHWTGQDLADFISVSVYTGLRISDVATFDVQRLLNSGECHIRTTKVGNKVYTWIPEWLQERVRERALVYGPRIFGASENSDTEVLTDLWRRKLVRLWGLCGPWKERPVHHRFRHTFVRIMLQTPGVTIRDVAELIGDTEESVRKHYAAWVPERQARVTKVLRDAFANKPKPNFLKSRENQAWPQTG